MMKRSFFLELINLNNQGVDEFAIDQDYAGAGTLFQQALQLLHAASAASNSAPALQLSTGISGSPPHPRHCPLSTTSAVPDDGRITDNNTLEVTAPPHDIASVPSVREIRPVSTGTHVQDASRLVESLLFVATRPIAISSSSSFFHENKGHNKSLFTENNVTNLAIFITFNLALSQHMRSFQAPPQEASKLRNSALRLYNVVLNLRIKRAPRCFKQQGSPFVMFDMSLLNNMGALHNELGNDDCTRLFFRKLDETLRRQVHPTHPLREEVHGLVGNVNLVLQIAHWESKPASAA